MIDSDGLISATPLWFLNQGGAHGVTRPTFCDGALSEFYGFWTFSQAFSLGYHMAGFQPVNAQGMAAV